MSIIEYLIRQCDTSIHLVTSLLVRNGSQGITLTDILGKKYQYRIDIGSGKGDIDPPLVGMQQCMIQNHIFNI